MNHQDQQTVVLLRTYLAKKVKQVEKRINPARRMSERNAINEARASRLRLLVSGQYAAATAALYVLPAENY